MDKIKLRQLIENFHPGHPDQSVHDPTGGKGGEEPPKDPNRFIAQEKQYREHSDLRVKGSAAKQKYASATKKLYASGWVPHQAQTSISMSGSYSSSSQVWISAGSDYRIVTTMRYGPSSKENSFSQNIVDKDSGDWNWTEKALGK